MDTKNRPTVEITTQGGHTIVTKSYATGREANIIKSVYIESIKASVVGNVAKIDSVDLQAEERAINKMIELMVVSVDGVSDDILNQVLDLPQQDYNMIVEKLDELTGKKKQNDTSNQ